MKAKPLALAVGVALFVGGGALAFWALGRRSSLMQGLPAGANAIPSNAVVVASLSTDEGQWRRLRQFGTAETQAQFDQALVDWRDRLLTDAGLNFNADLRPWVGSEITLAVLPSDRPGASPLTDLEGSLASNVVVALPINNVGQAQQGLGNRLVQAEGIGDNPYRGITIQQMESGEGEPIYGAVLSPELALVSPQVALLRQSIDAFRDNQSVVERPGFTRAFEQVERSRALARLYVDVPSAVQALANTADPAIPASRLEALRTPRSLVAAVLVENQGVAIQAISWLDQGPVVFNTSNPADQMPQRLPASTLIMLSTGNFQQFWEDFKAGRQLSAAFPLRPEEIALGIQSSTGLVMEEDLVPWMGGEMTLGILEPPAPSGSDAPAMPNPALVMMVKASDRDAATAALNRLNAVMADRYRYRVETVDQGGVAITQWVAPFDSLTMAHGWLEGDVVFFTIGQGITDLIVPRPNRALATASAFQATTGRAPRPNNGHFFINLRDMATVENSLLLPPLPTEGLISAAALEAIGVTATVLSDRQVRYDITTTLRRGNRPGPLPAPAGAAAPEVEPSPDPEPSPEPAPEANPQ
ncbi:hypothetical protein GFS31_07100 [Leptolyngbya sp. BL0902]|uniref:DUF3352 domain-containing protein n=1 Tax=Leptolyngbya sp. BL0902 TaxID=1115757 RepID=UPI0018E81747|nr:DUF3352 domain-containing protein [Leptolyngbya sp. BL0902]QQE64038.1 hypothetical protein GFS31_07100 [Leptolyngbya sp. BL0902]